MPPRHRDDGGDSEANILHRGLFNAFTHDPLINEYGIILQSRPTLLPAIPLYLNDHKLGIPSWAIKQLTNRAVSTFKAALLSKKQSVDSEGVYMPQSEGIGYSDCRSRDESTVCMKEWVCRSKLSLSTELTFTSMVLQKHPKSGCTWQYRRFLLAKSRQGISSAPVDYTDEFLISTNAAGKYPKNYMAWDYRRLVLASATADSDDNRQRILEAEIKASDTWLVSHIGDSSALCYRAHIVQSLSELWISTANMDMKNNSNKTSTIGNVDDGSKDSAISLLQHESRANREAIEFFPGHEAPWVYRRSIMLIYLPLLSKDALPNLLAEEHNWIQTQIGDHPSIDSNSLQGRPAPWRVGIHNPKVRQTVFAHRHEQWIEKQGFGFASR
eukprot:CFRG1318T1